jgi:hypothetical protein
MLGERWEDPKITCAAVYTLAYGLKLFHPPLTRGAFEVPVFRLEDAQNLLDELAFHVQLGARVVTWGGTAVDFRALHGALQADPDRQRVCKHIAQQHIDIPIATATDIGIMMGLSAAAKGTRQGTKSAFLSAEAPRYWAEGNYTAVLDHVKLDAVLTLRVYHAITQSSPPSLTWRTRSGHKKTWYCRLHDSRIKSVEECLQTPLKAMPFEVPFGMNRDVAAEWLLKP